jgi:hypothetical protein
VVSAIALSTDYGEAVSLLRILIALAILVTGLATSSVAAPSVGAPAGFVRFSLGGAEYEYADALATGSGWVLVGTSVLEGETTPTPIVTSLDASGKTLWQTRLGAETGLAAAGLVGTVTQAGSIWVAGVALPPPVEPTSTPTASPTGEPVLDPALDPDGVGLLDPLPEGRVASELVVHRLDSNGQPEARISGVLPGGWVGQPTALLPWKDGVLIVGTAIRTDLGGRAGFVMSVSGDAAEPALLLGGTSTVFTSAVAAANGTVLIAGSSSETLLGKVPLGAQDALVATFNGSKFSRILRSGGGTRIWNSISTGASGTFSTAGSATASGRTDAVLSNYTASGSARWSKRYPGSIPGQEQRLARVGSSLRLIVAATGASATLYPGWVPKGSADLLVLTIDEAKGNTTKVTPIASAGREELVDAIGSPAGGVVLLRSDGVLPGGTGPVILARLTTR